MEGRAASRRARNELLENVSEHTLHLKVFRRIPRGELEILFPNARIRFTLFDKLWLWFGSGGSAAAAIIMAVLKFLALVVVSPYIVLCHCRRSRRRDLPHLFEHLQHAHALHGEAGQEPLFP